QPRLLEETSYLVHHGQVVALPERQGKTSVVMVARRMQYVRTQDLHQFRSHPQPRRQFLVGVGRRGPGQKSVIEEPVDTHERARITVPLGEGITDPGDHVYVHAGRALGGGDAVCALRVPGVGVWQRVGDQVEHAWLGTALCADETVCIDAHTWSPSVHRVVGPCSSTPR